MAKGIQVPAVSRGLEKQFGIRGSLSLLLDEAVAPVQDAGDFAGSNPYIERGLGMDAQLVPAGGAGTFAGYLVRPGAGTVLVVEQYTLANDTGATRTVLVKLMRPVDIAAITITATSPIAQVNGRLRSTGFLPQLAAVASLVNHTTTTIGAEIMRHLLLAGLDHELEPKRGIVLDGTDPAGVPGLMFMINTSNLSLTLAGVHVTEYRATGSD